VYDREDILVYMYFAFSVNIIPEKVYDKLGVIGILQNPIHKLSTYNGHTLSTLGVCRLACSKANNTQSIEFYVVDTVILFYL
jgi:hypothetical protein